MPPPSQETDRLGGAGGKAPGPSAARKGRGREGNALSALGPGGGATLVQRSAAEAEGGVRGVEARRPRKMKIGPCRKAGSYFHPGPERRNLSEVTGGGLPP